MTKIKGGVTMKLLTDELKNEMSELIESKADKEAVMRELDVIYPSLISLADSIQRINLPDGRCWRLLNGD